MRLTRRCGEVIVAMSLAMTSGCGSDAGGGHEQPARRTAAEPEMVPEPVVMQPEAGFIDVGPASEVGATFSSRMFYAFQPADEHPEDAPLLVLFNGGPGAATTSVLWPYGTGRYTLDPSGAETDPPRANPDSYTRFANLLYIDARSTGFSYEVGNPSEIECAAGPDLPAWEASDFVMVLLEFMDAHESIIDNSVVLVGESYGGSRANIMLNLLQHYAAPNSVNWLEERVQQHFDRAFPEHAGELLAPKDVARQFGWQVLIQPSIFGHDWFVLEKDDPQLQNAQSNISLYSVYDSRRTNEDDDRIAAHSAFAARDPGSLSLLLGIEPVDVSRLAPASGRGAGYRLQRIDSLSESAMWAALGELPSHDAYWLPLASACVFEDVDASVFFDVAARTHTFLTNSIYDSAIYGDGIRQKFESTWGGTYDAGVPADSPRPGVIRFPVEDREVEIRFPEYEAGHEITLGAPREFGEDVAAWLVATGAAKPRP